MLLDNAPSGGVLRMKGSGNYTESGIGELQGFLRTDCEMLLCFFCVARSQKRLSTELIQELCYIVRRRG